MAYRSDDDAEVERLRALSAQVAELELRMAQRSMLVAHRQRVAAQLKDVTAKRRAKVPLPLLSRIRVASPCHERWDRMTGDERVRHCASCDKDVYDLSEMTAAEAEDLLASVGETACVRLHRRTDGTVITSDCPVGAKRKRRNRWLAAGAAIAGSAMTSAVALLAVTSAEKAPVVAHAYTAPPVGVMVLEPELPEEIAPLDYSVPVAGGIRMMPEAIEEAVDAEASSEPQHDTRRPRRRHRAPAR